MKCDHAGCTGVHANSRYHELCPAAIDKKRDRDNRYHATLRGWQKRTAQKYGMPVAELVELFNSRGDQDADVWAQGIAMQILAKRWEISVEELTGMLNWRAQ